MIVVAVLETATSALVVPSSIKHSRKECSPTATPFALQRLIPASGLHAWRMIALLLIVFTWSRALPSIAHVLMALSASLRYYPASGAVQSHSFAVGILLRATSNELPGIAFDLECGRDRSSGNSHTAGHAA